MAVSSCTSLVEPMSTSAVSTRSAKRTSPSASREPHALKPNTKVHQSNERLAKQRGKTVKNHDLSPHGFSTDPLIRYVYRPSFVAFDAWGDRGRVVSRLGPGQSGRTPGRPRNGDANLVEAFLVEAFSLGDAKRSALGFSEGEKNGQVLKAKK